MTDKNRPNDNVRAPLEQAFSPLMEPFREFVDAQSTSGWVLLFTSILALALANSPYSPLYFEFLDIDLGFSLGEISTTMTLQHWVNDGLMALFFFLLGLELKREMVVGRLSNLRDAGTVLSAAAGGMLLPAALFLSVSGAEVVKGWAIPIATDTAFALMILTLLGDRVPPSARAFLVGIAIVDDLGAILVIAFAYTSNFDLALVIPALLCLTVLAGVLVALAAPARAELPRKSFLSKLKIGAASFEEAHDNTTSTIFEQPNQPQITQDVAQDARRASSPLARWESNLEKPVVFVIVPLFAFMNAGVVVPWSNMQSALSQTLSIGILLGLLVGKPAGILIGLWLGKLAGLADLPEGISWRHVVGVGILGGIGFTMSLLVANLSFHTQADYLDLAKQSVIAASLLAGTAGYCWLRWACSEKTDT